MDDLDAVREALHDEIESLKVELDFSKHMDQLDLAAVVEALRDDLVDAKAELAIYRLQCEDLKNAETRYNLLQIENSELQHRNSELLLEISNLRDAIDGMAEDMGYLEARLADYMDV